MKLKIQFNLQPDQNIIFTLKQYFQYNVDK